LVDGTDKPDTPDFSDDEQGAVRHVKAAILAEHPGGWRDGKDPPKVVAQFKETPELVMQITRETVRKAIAHCKAEGKQWGVGWVLLQVRQPGFGRSRDKAEPVNPEAQRIEEAWSMLPTAERQKWRYDKLKWWARKSKETPGV